MPRAFTDVERQTIRGLLLVTAREAARRGDFRRRSVAQIARGVGISKGAFYSFFDSKEALYLAVLQQVQGQVQERLLVAARGDDGLRAVLRVMFMAAQDTPIFGALSDPDELAWLMRAVPPELVMANRQRDDAFFAALLSDLQARGLARPDLDPQVFGGLPPAAVALALHGDLVGEHRFEAVLELIAQGLALTCSPTSQESP